MSNHTPGPWIHAKDRGQVGSIELKDGTVIAQSQALVGDKTRVTREANARLIATAPELLDELENCLDLLITCFPNAPVDSCIGKGIIQANVVIAKATGQ